MTSAFEMLSDSLYQSLPVSAIDKETTHLDPHKTSLIMNYMVQCIH